MNIQIQLCGLFMLALLFIFYKSTKTLHLYKEKIFYRAMCIIIISLCLDILSLVSIFYRTHFPRLFVNFVCKAYLVTLIWGALTALIYSSADLFTRKKHQKIARYLHILALFQSIVTLLLPIHIFFQPKENLHLWSFCKLCVFFCFPLYFSNIIFCHWLC